jgi:type IX secretion system PorP/SprF family membrane protein
MNTRRYILHVLFMVGFSSTVWAQQNIQFTQYAFNSLSVNPAYAGYKEAWFLQLSHRTQWVGLDGAPASTQISFDGLTNPDKKNIGIGLQLTNDILGAQSTTSAYFNYSYRLPLDVDDSKRLCLGLGLGVSQYGLDGSLLNAVDQTDPLLSDTKEFSYIPDARFGMYYYNEKWYLGLSFMDLFSGFGSNSVFNWQLDSTLNIIRKTHCYFMGGALINVGKNLRFRPGFLYKTDFEGPSSWDLGVMAILDDQFWLGLSYRSASPQMGMSQNQNKLDKSNSLNGIVRLQVSSDLYVGYSFDWNVNELNTIEDGTHEISIGWTFSRKIQRVLSPRFF